MLNTKGEVLYVGKAKNLRKSVSSYARVAGQDGRITKMIAQTAGLDIIITQTEAEALLLEAHVIKTCGHGPMWFSVMIRATPIFFCLLIIVGLDWKNTGAPVIGRENILVHSHLLAQ